MTTDAGLQINAKKTRAMTTAETEIKLKGEDFEYLPNTHT